jgi:hypothetical protein
MEASIRAEEVSDAKVCRLASPRNETTCERQEPSQPRRLPCSGLHPLLGSAPLAAQIAGETFYVGAILIEAPWSWPMTDGTRMVGGYVKITNIGRDPDRLVGGSTEVSGRFEVHRSSVADSVARMELLTGGL